MSRIRFIRRVAGILMGIAGCCFASVAEAGLSLTLKVGASSVTFTDLATPNSITATGILDLVKYDISAEFSLLGGGPQLLITNATNNNTFENQNAATAAGIRTIEVALTGTGTFVPGVAVANFSNSISATGAGNLAGSPSGARGYTVKDVVTTLTTLPAGSGPYVITQPNSTKRTGIQSFSNDSDVVSINDEFGGFTLTNSFKVTLDGKYKMNGIRNSTVVDVVEFVPTQGNVVVPEPASLAVWGVGLGCFGLVTFIRRRRA